MPNEPAIIYLGELGPWLIGGAVAVLLAVVFAVELWDRHRERRRRGFEVERRRE